MGKFGTSTQEAKYVTSNCSKCVHYGNPRKGKDCPVMLIHWLYMDRRNSNIELATILDSLIPLKPKKGSEGYSNLRCKMFHKKMVVKNYSISHASQDEIKH